MFLILIVGGPLFDFVEDHDEYYQLFLVYDNDDGDGIESRPTSSTMTTVTVAMTTTTTPPGKSASRATNNTTSNALRRRNQRWTSVSLCQQHEKNIRARVNCELPQPSLSPPSLWQQRRQRSIRGFVAASHTDTVVMAHLRHIAPSFVIRYRDTTRSET